ncbi:bi-domain-containing oxidoreductase [Candidatus Merdisoma sp. JLR.KK006]|uniref:bi-domain-containing oxidoreductase n=1 Tax=Candidatus Merdisoma sp. JLR.KK006 TaxID=3112626 RepID=UPI002FF1967E
MKQLFLSVSDGSVNVAETPAPTVKENTVIIETLYSVVSAGTERSLTSFGGKNLIQKAMERPDQVKKVTEKMSTDGILTTVEAAFGRLKDPMPMGYTAVGRIVEIGKGVTEVAVGDTVAAVGQAYHSEVNRVGKNLVVKVPDEVEDLRQAAFSALGGIALEGIHQAEVVPGESVAVVGLGLLGHITARILDAYGCDVIGFDVADKTLPDTRLKAFVNSTDDHAAELARSLTQGRGVDKVIITAAADSNAPIDLAEEITRDRGTICMIGVTRMELDRRPFYQKELSFKIARSYGPGRYDSSYEEDGVDYPIGYVRFTEGRNVEEFLRLLATKRLTITDLITHTLPFSDAATAYEMITKNPRQEKYIGVVLKYEENAAKWDSVVKNEEAVNKRIADKKQLNLGLIGAGLFARTTMLPVMRAGGLYHFKGLATTGGIASAQANEVFPFDYTTNDYRKLLEDADIDLIAISTQHNSHAKFIVEALSAGKNVYVEKPLCLTLEELERIEGAYRKSTGELFCGLNRRHAPLIKEIKKELQTDKIPAVYDYIANAGYIPPEHWTQDESKGGGRIIGEAVHFIDTIQSLDGSELVEVNLSFAANPAYPKKDNAIISLRFASGAVGTVLYTSMGSKKYPKEQLRVFSNGSVYVMDNYVGLSKYGSSKKKETKLKQDKGIGDEYRYIFDVVNGKRKNRIIRDVFVSHKLLIKELEKYKNGCNESI